MAKGKDSRYTVPWTDDEKVSVNGHLLVYFPPWHARHARVMLPGGALKTAHELREAGYDVIEPPRPRLKNHYTTE